MVTKSILIQSHYLGAIVLDLADNIGHLLQAGHYDQAQELALCLPDTIWGRVAACLYIEADIQKTSGQIWLHHSQIGRLDMQACRNLPRHLTPYELQWVLPSRTHDITHFRRTT